jgi:hypothetical protein
MRNFRFFGPAASAVLSPVARRYLTRRNLFRYGGGLTLLASGLITVQGLRTGVWETGSGPAYEPWDDWNTDNSRTLMPIVRAGILAANSHNTQPWQFRVRRRSILVYAETTRAMNTYDPFMRELCISLGCAIENMDLAARAQGFTPTHRYVTGNLPFKSKSNGLALAAKIEVTPSRKRALKRYFVIPSRRTNRGPYKDRAVRNSFLQKLTVIGNSDKDISLKFYETGGERQQIDNIILSATRDMVADTEMMTEQRAWIRLNQDAIEKFRDGPTIDTMGLNKLSRALAKMLPEPSADEMDEKWFEATKEVHLGATPVIGLFSMHNPYDKSQCLRLGRIWQKIHLNCTIEHMAVHPLNQPFKMVDREFQRRQDQRNKRLLKELIGTQNRHGAFAFRIGRAEHETSHSPRRPVSKVIIP